MPCPKTPSSVSCRQDRTYFSIKKTGIPFIPSIHSALPSDIFLSEHFSTGIDTIREVMTSKTYKPRSRQELRKLVNDLSVCLGDIDTSLITDMS